MLKKDFKARKDLIKKLLNEDFELAEIEYTDLVEELFKEKQYDLIVDLFFSAFLIPKDAFYCFEVAYSLNDQNKRADSKAVYEALLRDDPENSGVLNNLSNLCKEFGEIDEAWRHIQKAKKEDPNDEIIQRNFSNLASLIQEKEEKEVLFRSAIEFLENENDFVIGKLANFLANTRKDDSYNKGIIPIPKWKLKVLMVTDDQKASSLLDQWLRKGYIRKTGQRGQFNEFVYEVNPHLAGAIASLKPKTINPNWVSALTNLDSALLENLGYFEAKVKISKIKKTIRENLDRDIDELYINYVLKNSKSVVVLSGSVVELLLIYFLEKKKIKIVNYQLGERTVNKKLYECDLSDLLNYCECSNHLKNIVVHLGNISRLNRNYIHPGKELRENDPLNFVKANLCFSATLEILRAVT